MGILRADRVSGLGGANAFNGSVFFNGQPSSFLRTEVDSSDFVLGTSDFTIECWIYQDWLDDSGLIHFGPGGYGYYNSIFHLASTNQVQLYLSSNGSSWDIASGTQIGTRTAKTWHHLALCRSGSSFYGFVDGTLGATITFQSGAIRQGASEIDQNQLCIGHRISTFNGYISNFRYIKGTALYTAAFTPPVGRLEKTSDTIILCCQSPGNVMQEATGKNLIVEAGGASNAVTASSGVGPPLASHFAPDVGEDHGTTFVDNTKFDTLSYLVPPGGTKAESNRGRALIMGGGSSPGSTNQSAIQYFNIQSLGTTQYFGALTVARRALQSVGSSTRGVALGGIIHPTVEDTIDYVEFATTGNATDFGNLTSSGYAAASASNNTRGIWAGGYRPNNSAVVNSIDYITIATTGNAADFGDLTAPQRANGGGSNTTRAVFAGGAYPAVVDTIEYVTIASTGDATDFGNLTDARDYAGTGSSPTRTCFAGGRDPSNTNIIDYITTASTGNATDFGDTIITGTRHVIMSNSSRGVIGSDGSITNALDYITFATTGNSVDFGDQASSSEAPVVYSFGGCSDSHGGIS